MHPVLSRHEGCDERDGVRETLHASKRFFDLNTQPHVLYIVKPLTRELVRLEHDLPLPVALSALTISADPAAVVELAMKCEFRSLLAEYEKLAREGIPAAQGELF